MSWLSDSAVFFNASSSSRVSITKVWKGKKKLDLATMIANDWIRIYDGTQTEPDSHMAAFLDRAPVYKGLCWVVLPNYSLGNSPYIPNFTFEVGGTLEIIPNLAYYSQFLTAGTGGTAPYPPPEVIVTGQWIDIVDPSYWNFHAYSPTWDASHWNSGGYSTVDLSNWLYGSPAFVDWMAENGVVITKIKVTHSASVDPAAWPRMQITSGDGTLVHQVDGYVSDSEMEIDWSAGGSESSMIQDIFVNNNNRGAFEVSHVWVWVTSGSVPDPGPYE